MREQASCVVLERSYLVQYAVQMGVISDPRELPDDARDESQRIVLVLDSCGGASFFWLGRTDYTHTWGCDLSNAKHVKLVKGTRCPICDGEDEDPRGEGKRCFGYMQGEWIYCTRPEPPREARSSMRPRRLTGIKAGAMPLRCQTHHGRSKRDLGYRYRLPVHGCRGSLEVRGGAIPQPEEVSATAHVENGHRIWGLKGVKTFPYRLPELLAADPSHPVYICEGEKDVDNLHNVVWWRPATRWARANGTMNIPSGSAGGIASFLEITTIPAGTISRWWRGSLKGVAATVSWSSCRISPRKAMCPISWQRAGADDQILDLAAKAPEWTPPSLPVIFVSTKEFETNDEAIKAYRQTRICIGAT